LVFHSSNVIDSGMSSKGWRTYGTRAQNGVRKDFLGTRHKLLSHFLLFLMPDQCLYIVKCMRTHTHIWLRWDCVWITVATKS